MKHLLARWLGVHQQLEAYEQRCRQLVAQRDANRDLATEYARQLTALEEQRTEAAGLLRGAHRQLNLKHSSRLGQDMIIKDVRLLEGNK